MEKYKKESEGYMKKSWIICLTISLLIAATLLGLTMSVSANGVPGTVEPIDRTGKTDTGQSLAPFVNEYGKIKLSVDALGTLGSQDNIHVDKPNGGKVRKAYLLSATTGSTGYQLANGDVKLKGNDISWGKNIPSTIYSYNYWADITNTIKPVIDAAPSGIVDLPISEQNSLNIDGEILAVIFDDPNQTTNSTIILYFGAQNITGDTFTINTGRPINTDDPNLKLDLSLGISYGYQTATTTNQYSQIDVNGQRLTTSAGGQDDGQDANGALITVGGIGDSDDNPADPYAIPANDRSDDELYSLKPFVKKNDTTITINTLNPSNDDNIFFAALMLTSTSTINSINIDVSLDGNPATAEERAPYENIMKYFADSIYEESNGANKLGAVTFYTNSDYSNYADIVWSPKGWPHSNVAGFGTPGEHISMYDVFQDGGGKGVDYNFLADDQHQKAAGFTLGHEFGHFYYSLYDEYKCSSPAMDCSTWDTEASMPHSTDKPVTNSIMNSQWNALGFLNLLPDNYNWLNFSIADNTSGDTAQYRIYGASGWDTLARPLSQDPVNADQTTNPTRLYHSELASVKPAPHTASRIDLPGTARSELSVGWVDTPVIASSKASTLKSANSDFPYIAELNSLLGQNISYPDPIILDAFVHQDLKIADLNVTAQVIYPDATEHTVQFKDDGIAPDALAGDGKYSAILNYNQNGLYTIQITLDNHALEGQFVADGSQMSVDINGNSVPYPPHQAVTNDFSLSQSLLVSVGNVVADDYGNTPESASEVTPDDSPISGKIDYGGDADVFKITTLPNGITYIRVANLAFGMAPHLSVIAADKVTVLDELDWPSTGYLNVALAYVTPNTTIYAKVTDKNGNSGGLYQLSAGTPLADDTIATVYQLGITKSGTGSGTVTSSPAGIDCGTSCAAYFDLNSTVTLNASADSNSSFTGWEGDCYGSGSCIVTMDSAKSVNAVFKINSPATPSDFVVTNTTQTSITIGWDDVSDESGYKIYKWLYINNAWDFYYLSTVGANVTNFSDNAGSGNHYYQVSAYNVYGESTRAAWIGGGCNSTTCSIVAGPSHTATASPNSIDNPPSIPLPVSPKNKALITTFRPHLDWSSSTVPGGTVFQKYELQLAKDSAFTNPISVEITGLPRASEYRLKTNLDPSTIYYWRVRSFNSLDQYSAWSVVHSFRTFKGPQR